MNDFERRKPTWVNGFATERAGRAVVRASSSSSTEIPIVMSHKQQVELDANLAAIDEAQKVGLETGDRRVIGTRV